MLELSKTVLEQLDLDVLMQMLNPDFNIGRTYHEEQDKKWMIVHNYNLIADVNFGIKNLGDWETFGYPIELINQASIPSVYGSTPKACLIEFLVSYPKLILNPINTPNENSNIPVAGD